MHAHSKFSFDSSMEAEAAVLKAIDAGLSGIAFTDHLDVNYMPDGSDVYYDFSEYLDKITALKERYSDKIDVLTAVEIGLQPHVVEENVKRLSGFDFDYKIGSTHLISRIDPYDGSYFKTETDKEHGYRRYLQEVIKNIGLYHDYCTVGHLDYLVRYGPFRDNTMYYGRFRDEFEEILSLMIRFGLAFEVNTRSYDRTPMDLRVLKRFKELGGETVVIGSDAHRYDRIARNFTSAVKLIEYCGFKYTAHYKEMKPVYDKIS